MPAVAITDSNNLFGALECSEVLSAAGVQPIPGIQQSVFEPTLYEAEAKGVPAPSLVFLAQSDAGFKNLMRMTSRAFLNSRRDDGPCTDISWLEDLSEGVICLSGGFDGPLDRLLRAGRDDDAENLLTRLAELFKDRFYIELQRHEGRDFSRSEEFLLDKAYAASLPIVATNEPYFPAADDYEAHDALLCIAEGAYVHQDERRKVTPSHYFKTGAEMAALFADLPEAVSTTMDIAQRCAFRPRTHPPILPNFGEAAGNGALSEADELDRQAREGLQARLDVIELAEPEDAYWARLDRELGIIREMGFPGYFLIVADFIKWAKAQGIPVGPGRGSGAGSVVAWALTITDLDPLRFGLLFERFLNPERVSMPDFDIDFCQDRRDEVIRYVQEKYGRDRVAQIITFGKLQARAVVRDTGRVLGLPFGQVDRLCKLIPNNPAKPVTLAEAIDVEPKLQEERSREESVKLLLDTALRLEGLYRHASTHAAGVVIGDRPLDELTPLYIDPRADMPATQYNMKWVEPAGLVKFDFLGLKTLTVIERSAGFVRQSKADFHPDQIPLDDDATYEMLGEGAAVGVFQLESSGMRATLRAMQPDCLEDIIALISLYRPGPMENIPTYIDRKRGELEIDYLHPTLEPVLRETYGVIIYQEQVMRIAQILSGYSLGEADILRRAMGKKKLKEMDLQRARFVRGAEENQVDPKKASSIFNLVEKFAGYGFNKSHAAAYAYIAYQTAYLKANYPAEFLAGSMSLDQANTDKLAIFVKEARRTGIEVTPPHVNTSEVGFAVQSGKIIYALAAIKNVGEGAMEAIVDERRRGGPFKDIFDFAERAPLQAVGKRSLENLARAGAMDGLAKSRAEVLANIEMMMGLSRATHEARASAQGGLFDGGAAELEQPKLVRGAAVTRLDVLNDENAALGFYFSGHPLDDYSVELRRLNVTNYREVLAAAREGSTSGDVAVVIRTVRMRRSRNGNPFAWVECSDLTGDFEVTVFSEVLSRARDLFETGALLLLRVSAEDREGDVRLTCEGVRRLDTAAAQTTSQLHVSIGAPAALDQVRQRLEAVTPPTPQEAGEAIIRLRLTPEHGESVDDRQRSASAAAIRDVELRLGQPVLCTPSIRSALRSIEGVLDVELV